MFVPAPHIFKCKRTKDVQRLIINVHVTVCLLTKEIVVKNRGQGRYSLRQRRSSLETIRQILQISVVQT